MEEYRPGYGWTFSGAGNQAAGLKDSQGRYEMELERLAYLGKFPWTSKGMPPEVYIELTGFAGAYLSGELDCWKAILVCPCSEDSFETWHLDEGRDYLECHNCKRKLNIEEAGAVIAKYELALKRLKHELFERAQRGRE